MRLIRSTQYRAPNGAVPRKANTGGKSNAPQMYLAHVWCVKVLGVHVGYCPVVLTKTKFELLSAKYRVDTVN